jgi:hypothetical protein
MGFVAKVLFAIFLIKLFREEKRRPVNPHVVPGNGTLH